MMVVAHMTETRFQLLLTIIFDKNISELGRLNGWRIVLIITVSEWFSQMSTIWKEEYEGNCLGTSLWHSSQPPL